MKCVGLTLLLLACNWAAPADSPPSSAAVQALKPMNRLIGSWKGTGQPEGKRQQFWIENIEWSWRFGKDDAWLSVVFDQGKHFSSGELRAVPEKDLYRLTLKTTDKKELVYEGTLDDGVLTLELRNPAQNEAERLVFELLHDNRIVYRLEKKNAGRASFTRVYRVGATKKGVPFASGNTGPECVVTGGEGTMTVQFKGKTYYVCCTGCRDAFKADPEKFIKEFNERKAKEKSN